MSAVSEHGHFLYTGVNMEAKEQKLRQEYEQLKKKLEDPAIYSSKDYPALARRQSQLEDTIRLFDEKKSLDVQMAQAKKMAGDEELAELAHKEVSELEQKLL